MIIPIPKTAITIPRNICGCAFSFNIKSDSTYSKIGPKELMICAFMLGASLSAGKKNEIFIDIPQIAPNTICFHSILDIFCLRFSAKGKKIRAAPKNLINPRVKGGMSCRENLKIGGAIPQMRLSSIQ